MKKTDVECRVTSLGHIQRGATPVAIDRILASAFGVSAVDLIAKNHFDQMVVWKDRRVTSVPIIRGIKGYRKVNKDDTLIETAKSLGIYLRISPKSLNLFNFTHTFMYKTSEVNQSFESAILNTTDSFIRGLTINGTNAGQLLDQFKDELPQLTPWEENTFKYSISNLYPLGERFALSGMYSYINVQRNNYIKNPLKEDFSTNHLLDISLFYKLNKVSLIYLKLSASSNYLLGQNPLAYNRRSNHLFDHPYGQVNAGLVINF